ncbi:MAG: hypothetical protein KIS92_14345 [Planctomycetota bacterium]|nr:hypothetical protein [Planctomycetota bacterium]
MPAASGDGRLVRSGPHVVLHLAGTPEEMGAQHGALLKQNIRFLIDAYLVKGNAVISPNEADPRRVKLLAAVRRMRASLPSDFLAELDACAQAAEVDPEVLLLAQCEGDVTEAAAAAGRTTLSQACSAYAAFGAGTKDGRLECGRNMDYILGADVGLHCSLVTYYRPKTGHRFAAVGVAGVLTGWTLINDQGLVVANHLGGGHRSNLDAIPTLILTRLIAQRCGTIDEALAFIRDSKRMRGQIVWLAQGADPATGRPARAVAVEYDADKVAVREAEKDVLLVTNTNRVFDHDLPDADVPCGRYKKMRARMQQAYGKLDGSAPVNETVVNGSTFHAFSCVLPSKTFRARFQTNPGFLEESVEYPMPGTE